MAGLLTALPKVRPQTVRQFFALANQHMRWQLNDLARRLDEQPAAAALAESGVAAPPGSSDSCLSQDARRMLRAIEGLPEDEREVFELVRIQGLPHAEAAGVVGVSVKTVQRRSGLRAAPTRTPMRRWANWSHGSSVGISSLNMPSAMSPSRSVGAITSRRSLPVLASLFRIGYPPIIGPPPRSPGLFATRLHIFGIPIVFNILAFGIVTLITIVLVMGIRESATMNTTMVMLKLVSLASSLSWDGAT